MITTFRVQNYKARRDVTLQLTPMHLLIGPNDSGKTSILEALAALSRSVDKPVPHAFAGPWEGASLVTNGDAISEVRLSAEWSDHSLIYELGFRFQPTGKHGIVSFESIKVGSSHYEWSITGRDVTAVLQFHRNNDPWVSSLQEDKRKAILNGLGTIYGLLSGVQFYRWNPRLLATPAALQPEIPQPMESSGFGLSRCLDAILGYDRDAFGRMEYQFKVFFPEVEAIRLIATPAFQSRTNGDELVPLLQSAAGKGLFFRFKEQQTDISAVQVSEGMLLILAYLAILYSPNPPRLLLIEEPENGVHPERLKEVITILRELMKEHPETQVVMTSHSPYIVSLFEPEEVTLCRKDNQGEVQVKRLSDSQIVKDQLKIFSLGEIWPAEEERIFKESNGVAATPAEATP